MPNDQFRANFKKLLARSNAKMDTVVKKATFEIGRSLVMRSPVDTGRFRSNWMPGIGAVNSSIVDDKSADATQRISAGLAEWDTREAVFYICNSLPYARRLEYGWSQQAPQGMVRLTVANFKEHIRAAAEALK